MKNFLLIIDILDKIYLANFIVDKIGDNMVICFENE